MWLFADAETPSPKAVQPEKMQSDLEALFSLVSSV